MSSFKVDLYSTMSVGFSSYYSFRSSIIIFIVGIFHNLPILLLVDVRGVARF